MGNTPAGAPLLDPVDVDVEILAGDVDLQRDANAKYRNPDDPSAYEYVPERIRAVGAGDAPWTLSRQRPSPALVAGRSIESVMAGLLQHEAHVGHLAEWIRFLVAFAASPAATSFTTARDVDARLQTLSKGLKVCPNQFRPGDFVWNCIQCQRDETCVLCNDCYAQSDHTNHEVRFTRVTQISGGCCDCGDAGAWDPAGFCPNHGASEESDVDSALVERAERVFAYSVRWIVDALAHLRVHYTEDVTFGELVVDTRDPAKASDQRAFLARFADILPDSASLARCRVSNANELEAATERMPAVLLDGVAITTATQRDANARVELRIVRLVDCLLALCQPSDVLSRACTVAFTGAVADDGASPLDDPDDNPTPLVEAVLENHAFMDSRENVLNLFLRLLVDNVFKERFALAYARAYRATTDVLLRLAVQRPTDEDKGLDDSVLRLAVQFLNRPAFVHVLVRRLGFLDTLLVVLAGLLRERAGVPGKPYVDVASLYVRGGYYDACTADLRHALGAPGVGEWLCASKLDAWVDVLAAVQGMHPQPRRGAAMGHVEHESRDWERAFNVALALAKVAHMAVAWMAEPDAQPATALAFARALCAVKPRDGALARDSWHIPVNRFVALGLTRALVFLNGIGALDDAAACRLPESTARAFAADASAMLARATQVRAGMWRRHGIEALQQEAYYTGYLVFSQASMELDVHALQLCCLALPAADVLSVLADAFRLPVEDDAHGGGEFAPALCEGLLDCVCALATELPAAAHVLADRQARELRRVLLHWLAIGPDSYGAFESNAGFCDGRVPDDVFARTLNSLADAQAPDASDAAGVSKYALREALWTDVNPFYFRLAPFFREKVLDQMRSRKRAPRPLVPPMPDDVCVAMLPVRTALLRASRGLALGNLRRACADTRWSRSLAASLHLTTLLAHAGELLVAGGLDAELAGACEDLCALVASPDTDGVIHDGARFVLDALASADAGAAALVQARLQRPGGDKDAAQSRKLDAQRRAMDKMRRLQQTTLGMDALAGAVDAAEDDDEEQACCVYCTRPAAEDAALGVIGFAHVSVALHFGSPERFASLLSSGAQPNFAYAECGHHMHFRCFDAWAPGLEFQCPLCKGLSNLLAPRASGDAAGVKHFLERLFLVSKTGSPRAERFNELATAALFVKSVAANALCDPPRAPNAMRVARVLLAADPRVRGALATAVRTPAEIGLAAAVVQAEAGAYARWLRAKVAQLLIDPLRSDEVDCAQGKFESAPRGALSEPEGDWWLRQPPGEAEALEAFREALQRAAQSDFAVWQRGDFRRGAELVRWTRRGADAFRRMAVALGCAEAESEPGLGWVLHHAFASDDDAPVLADTAALALEVVQFETAPGPDPGHAAAAHALSRRWPVALPADYTDLVSLVELGRCDSCDKPRHNSGLCLLCGQVLTFAPCARIGFGFSASSEHAMRCHVGVGCFFVFERRAVLWVFRNMLAEGPPLYVDKHGDWMVGGAGRGLPLRLDPRRVEHVANVLARNGVPREVGSSVRAWQH